MRLKKWFQYFSEKEKISLTNDLTTLILARKRSMCNVIEYGEHKVIYKSLYFAAGIDWEENELYILEVIHRYVQILDEFFGNVCEMDIIFNFDKISSYNGYHNKKDENNRKEIIILERERPEIAPNSNELPQITQPSRRKRTKKNIDLKFCRLVYQELKKRQHFTYAYPFYEPVNTEKLGVPEYYNVIKNPMDLSKVHSRLESEDYASAEEFEADIRLMFDNCYKFNAPGTDVYNMGKQLENVFDKKWAERPIPQPHSAAREKFKEEEESASDKESEQAKHLKALQKHLAALSSQLNQYRKSGKAKTKKPATKKTAKKATKSKLKSDADTSTDSIPKAKRRRTSKDDIDAFVNENDDKELSADQKAFLSKRIEYLPQELMATLIGMIQQSGATLMPEEGGYELEIESIDTKTAKRIYNFVMANTSEPNGRKQRKTPVKRKVQMSEEEQIKALEETLAKFDNKSTSPNKANDSSDDDSSDSQSSASSGSEPSDSDTAV
ncbi:11827_t:CDS:2 [Entrophospora sp. SA101]|nr:11827_t:CDS:2 [Entrophospora sp. SA101]